MELAAEIHDVKARRMLGGKYQALVVAPGVARLQSQAPDVDGVVHIKGGEAGEFVNVKLIKAEGFDFKGKIV
jgi:tRNA A37 methylthiotransferase MiaB